MLRHVAVVVPTLALLIATAPGCRSFNGGSLRRPLAVNTPELSQRSMRQVIDEHNQQVAQVESLKVVDLNVKVDPLDSGYRSLPRAPGYLLVERPQNLRLTLRNPLRFGAEAIDIGSNDRGFWFTDAMNEQMFVGNYQDLVAEADPLAASIQPEWILEVLGLQEIPGSARVEETEQDGLYRITEQRAVSPDVEFIKETVVNVNSGEIREHRLYTTDRKLIAQANVIGSYQRVSLPDSSSGEPSTRSSVSIPRELQLTLPGVARMTLWLSSVKVNPPEGFTATAFVKPDEKAKVAEGFEIHDIRELLAPSDSYVATPASRRNEAGETFEIPPPDPVAGVSDRPSPSNRVADRTVDLGAALAGSRSITVEESTPLEPRAYFEDQIPRGPEPVQRVSTWKTNAGERFPTGALGQY